MTKITAILLFCWMFPLIIPAQHLLPAPKKIEETRGSFPLKKDIHIIAKADDEVNAIHLINALKAEHISAKIALQTEESINIYLERYASSEELQSLLKKAEMDSTFEVGPEGYVLAIMKKKVGIFALSEAGIFYGIQTFKQIVEQFGKQGGIPCMTIYDRPDIAVRAWQDDISRGPVPTMAMLKKQIRTMASYKQNYFTLYTEHVFKLDKHPKIAPADGISKQQIKELSEYAAKYQVTLIGNYQSFGHMKKTLSLPAYQHLAENDHIISPALKESYQFLDEVYEEIVPEFSGEYFNINCDETFGLGDGASKKMVKSIGVSGVYAKHINKLNDLLKKYDKKILMWGDIATSYPEIVPQLPKDMTVMAWGYHPAKSFDDAITPITKQNLDFWVAPGVNCWSNVYPNLSATEINIYNFIRDGYEHQTKGVLNTSWDDDGLNFFNNCWHGFAWGAENSWNAPANLEEEASEEDRQNRYEQFNKAFDATFYGLEQESISDIMLKFSAVHQSDIRDALRNSRFFEGVFPIHFDYIQKGKRETNLLHLEQLETMAQQIDSIYTKAQRNQQSLNYLKFAVQQAEFTLKKNLFRIELNEFLQDQPKEKGKAIDLKLVGLIHELKALKVQYKDLWFKENRPHWLEENMQKFDELIHHLIQLDGHVIIEPLNEVDEKGRKISIRSIFNNYPIHYAINGDTVTSASTMYKEPIYIKEDAHIWACSIDENNNFPIQKMELIHHKGIGKLLKLNSKYSEYHPSYDGGGAHALLDGKQGTKDELRSGKWQGFSGQDIEIEIDLKQIDTLNSFSMGFFQNTKSWVIFPKQVEIYTKNTKAEAYQLHTTIEGKTSAKAKGNLKEDYKVNLNGLATRYIKVVARYYGKLPEWHHAGSHYESMIFADEIIIE